MIARILALACCVCVAAPEARSAQEVTEADLESASPRTVRVSIGTIGKAAVLDVPLEVYVARVLAGEGEPRAAAAAQQALAIAIRTFATANAGRHRREGFDLCDQTHCQVLRPSTPASRLAALATASQLLTYEGRPATVFYSASCGGKSEAASQVWSGAADLPYLRSADDDVHGADETWVVDMPLSRVEQTLRRLGFEGRRLRDVEVERRSESGRALMLRLSGLRPNAIAGDDFRAAIGARELRSTRFTVKRHGKALRFTGRGYGHGVGMCVVGAGRRAARGETAALILQQYFPGLRLEPPAALAQAPIVSAGHVEARPSAPLPAGEPASLDRPVESLRVHELARRARSELSATLGIANAPDVRLDIHPSVDAFRSATGRPWWVAVAVTGPVIELVPPAVLEESTDGLEASVRRAVAEAVMTEALAGRPGWVRVGAARYYGATSKPNPPAAGVKCPSDAELRMAVSAAAHRDAELRAEACFARALAKAGDWRKVR